MVPKGFICGRRAAAPVVAFRRHRMQVDDWLAPDVESLLAGHEHPKAGSRRDFPAALAALFTDSKLSSSSSRSRPYRYG